MIQSVQIQNFKSVVDLTLELGTFNVLIGANGCGKSNILEAIAFGAAASADKLDQEFLGSRGIRMTSPEFMFSAFNNGSENKLIDLRVTANELNFTYQLQFGIGGQKRWIDRNREIVQNVFAKRILKSVLDSNVKEDAKPVTEKDLPKMIAFNESIKDLFLKSGEKELLDTVFYSTESFDNNLPNYILYSPEQTSLRKFEDTNQIYPLGIKGEGLFQYLKELSQDEKNAEVLNEIKECLLLLDWYQDFNLPKGLMSNEFALSIKDKYLNENLQFFDQRSTNEGFLFLLFYATLFTSKDTPQFFAVDNIDTSFNPKLCMQITKLLAGLAKKHGKQVIVTTQNPAILDGLDLSDDAQRLFVVRRNEEGHTKAKRISYKAERTMKLSEVWTNGFIGGLPDNF